MRKIGVLELVKNSLGNCFCTWIVLDGDGEEEFAEGFFGWVGGGILEVFEKGVFGLTKLEL